MTFPICTVGDRARNEKDVHNCQQCPHDVIGPAITGSPTVHAHGKPVLRQCDKGVHTACCGSQTWEAIEGSASIYIDGRPVVRKNDATRHCGGIGKMIEGSAAIFVGGPSVRGRPIDNVAAFILDEMKTNACGSDASFLRDNLDLSLLDRVIPLKPEVDRVQAYERWYQLVRTGGDWDHKKPILDSFGRWSYDAAQDRSYSYETWSNIHYGYVGRASGFSSWILRAGAGFAQFMDHGWIDGYWNRRAEKFGDADVLAALDEAQDQAAITIGIELWEKYGDSLTLDHLMDAIRDASDKLKMLQGAAC